MGTVFFQSVEGGRLLLEQQQRLVPPGAVPVCTVLRDMLLRGGGPESDPAHLCTMVRSQPLTAAIDGMEGPERLALGLDEANMALVLHERLGMLHLDKESAAHAHAQEQVSWQGTRFTACLFLCGTIEDFSTERERLERCVLPAVARLLHERGLGIQLLDMRRSLHATDDTDGSRLSIVLSHIAMQQCTLDAGSKTFALGLLGEKEGWVPDNWMPPKAHPSAAHATAGHQLQWVRTPPYNESSVTAIAVHAAFLRNTSASAGLLCIRARQLSYAVDHGGFSPDVPVPPATREATAPVGSRSVRSSAASESGSPRNPEDIRRERAEARWSALKDASRRCYSGNAAEQEQLLDGYASFASFTNIAIQRVFRIMDKHVPRSHTHEHGVLLREHIRRQQALMAGITASFVHLGPRRTNVLNKILEFEAECTKNPCLMVITGPEGSGRTINLAQYARDRVARARPCFYYLGTGLQEDSELPFEVLTLQLLAFVGQAYPPFVPGRDVVKQFSVALQVTACVHVPRNKHVLPRRQS
jgi:hypothetical protein